MTGPRLLTAVANLSGLALVAACGDEGGVGEFRDRGEAAAPTAVPAATGQVTTTIPMTVLDDGHGAELCLGAIAASLPPQCGGPRLVGWDWVDHEGDYEQRAGVRWGDFLVTGTFDGSSVSPTEVVPADEAAVPDRPERDDEFTTPCPEPAGGWRVLDPALTTEASFEATMRRAEKLDGYAESWVDQSINPAWSDLARADEEGTLNDPKLEIINVRVTHDAAAAERELREGWGGSLCVSVAEHTEKELMSVQDDLNKLPGVLESAPGRDVVELMVTYDDGSYQRWADHTYGAGVVLVTSALVDAVGG